MLANIQIVQTAFHVAQTIWLECENDLNATRTPILLGFATDIRVSPYLDSAARLS